MQGQNGIYIICICIWSCLSNVLSVTSIKTKSQAITCIKATIVLGPTVAHQSEVNVLNFSDTFAIRQTIVPTLSKLQDPKLVCFWAYPNNLGSYYLLNNLNCMYQLDYQHRCTSIVLIFTLCMIHCLLSKAKRAGEEA